MCSQIITQKYLKELFTYDGEQLIWRISKGTAKAGSIAGGVKSHGYICIKIDGKWLRSHRLIWLYVFGKWPDNEIDHIDQNPLNNRIDNLRDVTHVTNLRNQKKSKNNTSGITGVTFNKGCGKWQAEIKINYKKIHLGTFDCKYRAASVRHLAQEIEGGYTDRHGK